MKLSHGAKRAIAVISVAMTVSVIALPAQSLRIEPKLNGFMINNSIALSPDGRIAAVEGYFRVDLWDLTTGQVVGSWPMEALDFIIASFSPDGQTLLTFGHGHAETWNVATGKRIRAFESEEVSSSRGVRTAAFSPDGRFVATGENDGTLILWNADSGETVWILEAYTLPIDHVAFLPGGKELFTADSVGNGNFWDVATGDPWGRLDRSGPYPGEINHVQFSWDGKYLITSSDNEPLTVWNATSGLKIGEVGEKAPLDPIFHYLQMEEWSLFWPILAPLLAPFHLLSYGR